MNDFQDRMESGKLNAARDRARGIHSGKLAAGHKFKRSPIDPKSWDALCISEREEYQSRCREAINTFLVVCLNRDNPNTWEILL